MRRLEKSTLLRWLYVCHSLSPLSHLVGQARNIHRAIAVAQHKLYIRQNTPLDVSLVNKLTRFLAIVIQVDVALALILCSNDVQQ